MNIEFIYHSYFSFTYRNLSSAHARFSFVCSQRVICCTRTMELVKIHWPVFDDGDLLNFVECVPSTSTPPSAIRQYPPRSTSSRSQFEWVKQDISDNTYLIPPISLAPIQIGWVNWYHSLIGWLRLSHQSRTHSSPIAAKSIKSTSNRCINKL